MSVSSHFKLSRWVHTIVSAQPYDVFRFPIPTRNDAIPLVFFWIPSKVVPALFQSVLIHLNRCQRKDEIILGYGAVMNHAAEWRRVPAFLCLFPIFVNCVDNNITARIVPITSGFIAIAHHLTSVWIELGMSGKGRRLNLAVKVVPANGLKSNWAHSKRRPIFFHRKQNASPEDDVGIRCCSDDAFHHLIVGIWISVFPEQCLSSFSLGFEAICVHVSLPEIYVAILKPKRRNGAIAVEMNILLEQGWELVIRLYTIEGTIYVFGYLDYINTRTINNNNSLQCRSFRVQRCQPQDVKVC
jgi:hypothetical protein